MHPKWHHILYIVHYFCPEPYRSGFKSSALCREYSAIWEATSVDFYWICGDAALMQHFWPKKGSLITQLMPVCEFRWTVWSHGFTLDNVRLPHFSHLSVCLSLSLSLSILHLWRQKGAIPIILYSIDYWLSCTVVGLSQMRFNHSEFPVSHTVRLRLCKV